MIKKMKKNLTLILGLFILMACTNKTEPEEAKTLSGLKKSNFITELDGKQTDLFVLKNSAGMEVCITNYGGRIVSAMVPDRDGAMQDVVLGFDSIADYINIPNNFGTTVGRYANRIANGKMIIDGIEYQLPQNNLNHTIHGGDDNFAIKVFDAIQIDNQTLEMTYTSKDGESGFPGNLTVKVTMTLTKDNAIDIKYEAETDKKTVVNLTNHSFFNLSGNPENTILDYELTVNADSFTPIDSTSITTGEIIDVEGTDLDFRTPRKVGDRIDNDYNQLKYANGYDHNWVLNSPGDISTVAATVYSPKTGIELNVYTTEPGMQVYTGNFLNGTVTGKRGINYKPRTAICLEPQKYPDAPNNPDWPSAYLSPGETYTSRTIYQFAVKE